MSRRSATGGRQVRAELEGIGEAGTCGMGRLSRVHCSHRRCSRLNRCGCCDDALDCGCRRFDRPALPDGQSQPGWVAASATVGIEQEKLTDIPYPICATKPDRCVK